MVIMHHHLYVRIATRNMQMTANINQVVATSPIENYGSCGTKTQHIR